MAARRKRGNAVTQLDLSGTLDLAEKDLLRLDIRVDTSAIEREASFASRFVALGKGSDEAERLELRWEEMRSGGGLTVYDSGLLVSSEAPSRGLLGSFIELVEAESDAITAFARRWGLLGICRHGRPAGHHPDCGPCEDVDFDGRARVQWELIEAWRRYARLAKELLEISADLSAGREPRDERWNAVIEALDPSDPPSVYKSRYPVAEAGWFDESTGDRSAIRFHAGHGEHTNALSACLRVWLRYGNVHTTVGVGTGSAMELMLSSDGLFGRLGLQLVSVIGGRTGVYRCDAPTCGRLFEPSRRPQVGRSHFCKLHSEQGRGAKLAWWNKNKSRYRTVVTEGKDGDAEARAR